MKNHIHPGATRSKQVLSKLIQRGLAAFSNFVHDVCPQPLRPRCYSFFVLSGKTMAPKEPAAKSGCVKRKPAASPLSSVSATSSRCKTIATPGLSAASSILRRPAATSDSSNLPQLVFELKENGESEERVRQALADQGCSKAQIGQLMRRFRGTRAPGTSSSAKRRARAADGSAASSGRPPTGISSRAKRRARAANGSAASAGRPATLPRDWSELTQERTYSAELEANPAAGDEAALPKANGVETKSSLAMTGIPRFGRKPRAGERILIMHAE